MIDAAIIQHVVTPNMFRDSKLSAIERSVNSASNNQNGIESSDIPIAEMVQAKIQSVFKQFDNAGRTPALWTLYYYMVETIRIFIRAEHMGDFSLHLSYITNRMLDIFAAGGHHNYAKATQLYVQMMLKYGEGYPEQQAVTESFKMIGSHVVRYSIHELSRIWSDLCIEQTLMRTSKSNGGLSGGRFRNGESAHRCWVQTLSHLSLINRLLETVAFTATHRDLALAQRLEDAKEIPLVNSWLEEMETFHGKR